MILCEIKLKKVIQGIEKSVWHLSWVYFIYLYGCMPRVCRQIYGDIYTYIYIYMHVYMAC